MTDTVERIKDKLSIIDVVSQFVKLERSGANLRARCPFHAERTPSFFVSPERGTYHCFGCNVGGDIFSFVQQIEGLDFKGALKVLAEKAGVPLDYSRGAPHDKGEKDRLFELLEAATIFYSSQLNDDARKYLRERGIKDSTMGTFRLGFAAHGWSDLTDHLKVKKFSEKEILDTGVGKPSERGSVTDKFRNRIMFPIGDSAGRVIGFSGRTFGEKASPEAPKYLNSPETLLFHKTRILYAFDKAKLTMRKHDCAVLVEGQIDLLASHQAGWSNTIATLGTAFTVEHAATIKRITENLVIAFDADPAGIKATGRAARVALQGGLNVKIAKLPAALDPAEFIRSEGKEAWSKTIREAQDIIVFLLDVLQSHAKSTDIFRRSVESIVLPYLADIQSPIAREHYIRDIATCLNVSEKAVWEAFGKVPRASLGEYVVDNVDSPAIFGEVKGDRARSAFSMLLWQKTLAKPHLDTGALERGLEEAIGSDALMKLKALPGEIHEMLRFAGERMYEKSSSPDVEMKTLLDVLLKERLTHELVEATEALRSAETRGDEHEVAVHMSVCNVLTKRIAKLHEVL